MPVLNASTPQIVRFRRDWIMGSVVMVNVNREPPDRFAESLATVLSHKDCKPQRLQHPVCRQGKCQHGVKGDYCGNDSDCISTLTCHWSQCACVACYQLLYATIIVVMTVIVFYHYSVSVKLVLQNVTITKVPFIYVTSVFKSLLL